MLHSPRSESEALDVCGVVRWPLLVRILQVHKGYYVRYGSKSSAGILKMEWGRTTTARSIFSTDVRTEVPEHPWPVFTETTARLHTERD